MRKLTLALAAVAAAACADNPSRVTSPTFHPESANPTIVAADGNPSPSTGDRVFVDTRTSLQQAANLAQAEALFRGNDHTAARTTAGGLGWAFVKNFDGAGTSALRADWPTAKRCSDETNRIIDYLPDPLPKTLYVQWKTHFGRTSNDAAGNGAVNAYTIENNACPTATAFAMNIYRDNDDEGPDGDFTLEYTGRPQATAELLQSGLGDDVIDGNQGWTFAPSQMAGSTVKFTMFMQASSNPTARDGVLRLWINGKLYFEATNVPTGQKALSRFEFPGWRYGTVAESEYIWDVLAWASDPGPATSIVVAPPAPSITVGDQVQLSASAYDANGRNAMLGNVKWTTSDNKTASVDGDGTVTGKAAGTATITATSGKVSGTATVTVNAPPPAKIAVKPANVSLKVGDKQQLTATVSDAKGKTMSATVTWASADPTIATVDQDGTVHGVAAGVVKVTASIGTLSAASTVTVTSPPVPKLALKVTLINTSLIIGQTTQASVTFPLPIGSSGTAARPQSTRTSSSTAVASGVKGGGAGTSGGGLPQTTWTSSNTAVATVSSAGVVSAVAPGSANITATIADLSGMATVTVSAPAPAAGVIPAPAANSTILLDMRQSLQQATTIDGAFALFGIVDHTPYRDADGPNPNGVGWSFTTNADGNGLHALRADWSQSPYYNGYTATGPTPLACPADALDCHDEGVRVIDYLPDPKPTELYAQWKGRWGRFAADATGNGAANSYALWPQTDACKRALFDHADDSNRVDYTLARTLPEEAKVEIGEQNYARLDVNNVWNPNAFAASGQIFTTTVHVKAASGATTADGVFQMWIDGTLVLDWHDVPSSNEAFDRWSFPETCITVSQPQSEYFWDILVWRP